MMTGGVRWSRRAVLIATVGGLIPAAGLTAHLGRASHQPWTSSPTRRIEARLEHPQADVYKPYRVERNEGGTAPLTYEGLSDLQSKGDLKGLADRLLAQKASSLASRVLASASEDRSLDNERGVLALIDDRPNEAVHFIEGALAHDPRSPQALWNRALALRNLGLGFASSAAFSRVAAQGEPGWSDEARHWAASLQARTEKRRQSYQAAEAQARRMASEHVPPAPEIVEQFPEVVRFQFYNALRTAPSREVVDRLTPLAKTLDQRLRTDHLEKALQQVQACDFKRRAPLATRYGELRNKRWKESVPGSLNAFVASLRAAGPAARDLLVGVLLTGKLGSVAQPELLQIAESDRDPWLAVTALQEAAWVDPDTSAHGTRERLLERGIALASKEHLLFRRLELQIDLGELLLRQQRPLPVGPLVRETRAAAESAGLWSVEVKATAQLAHLSSYLQDASVVKAYGEEVALSGAPCAVQLSVQSRLAERAMNDGRTEDARSAFIALESCAKEAPLKLPALSALSELARVDPTGQTLDRFRRELARYRNAPNAAGSANWRIDSLSAKALEGRAVIDSDPETGRRLLAEVIAEAQTAGLDNRETALPRLLAYRRLIADAVKHNELPHALSLIAAEGGVSVPPGCVLGIAEDQRKVAVMARLPDGRSLGTFGNPAALDQPQTIVPPEMRRALATCPEVAVLALSPFRGQARLLGPELAWRHHAAATSDVPDAWTAARHVVVSDVLPPPSFGLPLLAPWQPPAGVRITRHLRGAEATPTNVTDELAKADLIEFHVHGLTDFRVAEAPYLVLSEDKDGKSRLEADAVGALTLNRRPFVVLAACNSAVSSPYFPSQSGRWSLPSAFIRAGARAVLAANDPIPDEEATAFIGEIMNKVQAGVAPAVALRDVRMEWLKRHDSWTDTIVLFQ